MPALRQQVLTLERQPGRRPRLTWCERCERRGKVEAVLEAAEKGGTR